MNWLDFAARFHSVGSPLKISDDSVVTFLYTLKDEAGAIIDQSDGEPMAYLHGQGQIVPGHREIGTDAVTVDGNHPLAGKDPFFDIEIAEVRAASQEELARQHVRGPGGHHH